MGGHESKIESRAICILGMHRSGTSVLSGALNILGVFLGEEEELIPALDYNPKGFWERKDINDLQERLLASMKRKWDTAEPLSPHWQSATYLKPFRDEIIALIRKNFFGVPLWGWKDPRSTIFIDLWKDILTELGIKLSAVFAVRNPLDVARSLQKRDGFSLDKGFGIWFNYNISALRELGDIKTAFLLYDSLLADWETTLRGVAESLAIPWPKDETALREEMAAFIRPNLRHSASTEEDLKKAGAPLPVVELYALFQRLLVGEPLGSTPIQTTINHLWETFSVYARFFHQDMTDYWEKKEYIRQLDLQLADSKKQLVDSTEKISLIGQQLLKKDEQLVKKDEQMCEKDKLLHDSVHQLARKDEQLALKDKQLSEKEQWIIEKEKQVNNANQQLRKLTELDHRLSELDHRLAEKDQQLSEKTELLAAKDQQVNDLLNSFSWKMTAVLRWLAKSFMTK